MFAYLHLCQHAGSASMRDLPPWETIATMLEEQRYFLELAAFQALLGARTEAAALLDRVCMQRTWREPLVFSDWLGDGVLTDWERLVSARAAEERQVLTGDDALTPETLLVSGLLPL